MATLTVRDVSDKALDKYKEFSGQKTAVKALLACADKALAQDELINDQVAEIARLKEQVSQRNQVLESLVPLCAQVAELAGQDDLFSVDKEELSPEQERYLRWENEGYALCSDCGFSLQNKHCGKSCPQCGRSIGEYYGTN